MKLSCICWCSTLLVFGGTFLNSVLCDDLYTSIDGLELLIQSEKQYLDALETYVNKESERLEILEKENNRRKTIVSQEPDRFDNLINEYLLAKASNEANFFAQSQVLPGVKNFNNYCEKTKNVFIGQDEDMKGAAVALLRVQDTYQINASDISEYMTTDDCFFLGHVSILEGRFDQAVPWLLEVEKKMASEPDGVSQYTKQFNLTVLYDYLAYSMREQHNYEWALFYMTKIRDMGADYPWKVHIDYFEQMLQQEESTWDGTEENLPVIHVSRFETDDEVFPEYEALCRGEDQNTTYENQSVLYCYYKTNTPFLKLAPIKVELLHRKPDVFWFPEALSDFEIEQLLDIVSGKLDRSLVVNPNWKEQNESKEVKSKFRTSKITPIDDDEYELSEIITKRVSDMTDLSMEPESTESLQIANYGIGGHYSPHFDMATADEDLGDRNHMFGESGNRIGTMLFYLSDPVGGGTAFDHIGVTVFAKKRGAVFWWNLHRNGQPDLLTHHGGCPVLYGQKWIANKWMHERGQEFRRPCSLNPDE